jgi:hypothetical protein
MFRGAGHNCHAAVSGGADGQVCAGSTQPEISKRGVTMGKGLGKGGVGSLTLSLTLQRWSREYECLPRQLPEHGSGAKTKI